jgi:uncharacterized protein (TIGR03437 family)
VRVQVAPGALAAGVYRGVVTFSFGDGSVTEVTVAAVLRAGAGVAAASGEKAQDGSCLPRRQVMVNTRLPNNFSLPTGWPVPMTLRINNDCGEPVVNSTVAASFNNGDPPLVMLNLQDGQYSGTWVPARVPAPAAPAVQVFLSSVNPQLPEATLELTGTLGLDTTNPILNNNGIVNGASFAAFQPVSPGSIFSLFGSNLTPPGNCFGGFCAESFPLPKSLGGVSVKFGGIDVPLFFAGPTQINGQVPVELAGLTSAAVVVTARGITSTQQEIQLDLAQPGIFKTGATQGAVLNQDNAPNSAANPAARGSVLQIYATGLGATNPAVSTGDPAPSSPSFAAVTNPVTLTVGGVSAVVEFQALAPGFVGLYQVNARIPTEVSPGSAVPVKIIQNGIESNEATVAIQ